MVDSGKSAEFARRERRTCMTSRVLFCEKRPRHERRRHHPIISEKGSQGKNVVRRTSSFLPSFSTCVIRAPEKTGIHFGFQSKDIDKGTCFHDSAYLLLSWDGVDRVHALRQVAAGLHVVAVAVVVLLLLLYGRAVVARARRGGGRGGQDGARLVRSLWLNGDGGGGGPLLISNRY